MSISSPKLSKEELRRARLRAMGHGENAENRQMIVESNDSTDDALRLSTPWIIDNTISGKLFDIVASKDLLREDINRWFLQGFSFCSFPPFGLRQRQGGPCGVLAAVQAEVIKEILFSGHPNRASEMPSTISKEVNNLNLAIALTAILHRATVDGTIRLVITDHTTSLSLSNQASFVGLHVQEFSTIPSCQTFIKDNMSIFESPSGCIIFLVSLILTRGVEQIRSDMDDSSSSLLGQYGHCTQELVNLLLTGRAASNVFDGDLSTGAGFTCKGIQKRSDIGYLTHLEAMRYLQVGSFYKCPSVPVWVVGSSSHFTVLFSTSRAVNESTGDEELLSRFRRAFKTIDVDESGFIPAEQLNQLLESVDAMKFITSVAVYKKLAQDLQLDTNSVYDRGVETVHTSGIVLWSLFWEHVSLLATGRAQGNQPTLASPTRERFRSDSDIARELQAQWDADGDLPPPPPMAVSPGGAFDDGVLNRTGLHRHDSIADDNAAGHTMHHFNGLEGPGSRQPRLTRFTLYMRSAVSCVGKPNVPLDEGVFASSHGLNPLEEILRTRWQGCRTDWRGESAPSID